MKKYHITYYENKNDIYAKGYTIKEESHSKALNEFDNKFPNVIFHSLTVKN